MSVKVTVGVCVKDSEKIIKAALDSIVKQNFPHKLMKLVVVDDGSKDKTLSIVRDIVSNVDIKTVICSSGGRGLGFSRQIVVNNAQGDYIVWVDGDVVLRNDFIQKLVEFMESNPGVGVAAGKPIFGGETLVAILESTPSLIEWDSKENVVVGGTIYRLKATKQIRGFDSNIKGAGEDTDIISKIKKAGWEISADSSAEFYHNYRTSWKALWDNYFWYGYGMHYIAHKHPRLFHLWEKMPPVISLWGLKLSFRSYKLVHQKKVFLLALQYFFKYTGWCLGFLKAHINGYGHLQIMIDKNGNEP